ncbi:MAG: DUF1611 domain-containing protein [Balneolaceae bacterium]|nr:MAG: DUF1611 domain-containing protein [Balneolaceae bacterium]
MINTPYLLFLGDAPDSLSVKVARGIRDWRPEYAIAQYRMNDCNADLGIPDMTLMEAREAGAQTFVIGVANRGGTISENWKEILLQALEHGFDLASGLHQQLKRDHLIVFTADKYQRQLFDVRIPQREYPIANGEPRTGKRCLTVGTDCSVGKMYTSLAMEKEMHRRKLKATFKATGQTGILITGEGIPLDAIPADFMAGAVEWLTPNNDEDHWDLIEGQGSLFHISFSGISLALIHGGQPDALILCHEPTREHMRGIPGYQLPSLEALRDLSLQTAQIANPDCKVIGISINTSELTDKEADEYLDKVENRMGLPAVDPYKTGAGRLVDALQELP